MSLNSMKTQMALAAITTDISNKVHEIVTKEHPEIIVRAFQKSIEEHPELWGIIVKASQQTSKEE